MTPLRELQLLEDHRRGDPHAISELLRDYQKRIYGVCYRMLRNHDEAADLTQESLIKVIEGLESYDGRAKLSTWVIRVTMNCCLSHLRKEKVRSHVSLDAPAVAGSGSAVSRSRPGQIASGVSAAGGPNSAAGAEPTPLERIERNELHAILIQALHELDPQMRAVLVLRDMQDLDYQQLGEVLEIPIGTVKSRLFRARAALRAAVEEKLEARPD